MSCVELKCGPMNAKVATFEGSIGRNPSFLSKTDPDVAAASAVSRALGESTCSAVNDETWLDCYDNWCGWSTVSDNGGCADAHKHIALCCMRLVNTRALQSVAGFDCTVNDARWVAVIDSVQRVAVVAVVLIVVLCALGDSTCSTVRCRMDVRG
jgi:hypothetical protein